MNQHRENFYRNWWLINKIGFCPSHFSLSWIHGFPNEKDSVPVSRTDGAPSHFIELNPKWYLTSPSNQKTQVRHCRTFKFTKDFVHKVLPMMLANTFNLPRCAIPMTSSSTPVAPVSDYRIQGCNSTTTPSENRFLTNILGMQKLLKIWPIRLVFKNSLFLRSCSP